MRIIGLDHVVLHVVDVRRSLEWYSAVLGVEPEGVDVWERGEKPFASLRVNDSLLIDLIEQAPTGVNCDHFALVIDRDDFEAFVASPPVELEMGPMELSGARGIGMGCYLRDPDGHRLELRSY